MKINLFLLGLILLLPKSPLPQYRTIVPPGTVRIVDNFYVDQTEVTNLNWREYLSWLEVHHGPESEAYKNAQVDTSVWQDGLSPMALNFFQHPAFDNYPVVGVSHQQAENFCRWRTQVVKEMLAVNYTAQQWEHLKNLEYRLPTLTEWELIARLNRDRARRPEKKGKYAGRSLFNVRRTPLAAPNNEERLNSRQNDSTLLAPINIYTPGDLNIYNHYGDVADDHTILAPVNAYPPGDLDIYNLYGNVAEMVTEPRKAMGGAWIHTEREALSTSYFSYDQPSNWVGFRCVCSLQPTELKQF